MENVGALRLDRILYVLWQLGLFGVGINIWGILIGRANTLKFIGGFIFASVFLVIFRKMISDKTRRIWLIFLVMASWFIAIGLMAI